MLEHLQSLVESVSQTITSAAFHNFYTTVALLTASTKRVANYTLYNT